MTQQGRTNARCHARATQRGFMMIELLAVMAIILILFCLYWGGGLMGPGQKDFAACAKNLQFVHTSLMIYAADHNEQLPFVKGAETSDAPLALLVPKYTSQTSSFICPSSGDHALPEGKPFTSKRISYAYVMGLTRTNEPTHFLMSDEQIDTKVKGTGARAFSADGKSRAKNHGKFGGNVLHIDGSVETMPSKTTATLAFDNGVMLNPKPNR